MYTSEEQQKEPSTALTNNQSFHLSEHQSWSVMRSLIDDKSEYKTGKNLSKIRTVGFSQADDEIGRFG